MRAINGTLATDGRPAVDMTVTPPQPPAAQPGIAGRPPGAPVVIPPVPPVQTPPFAPTAPTMPSPPPPPPVILPPTR